MFYTNIILFSAPGRLRYGVGFVRVDLKYVKTSQNKYVIICLRNADSRYIFHLRWTHYVTVPVYYLLTATDAARRLVLMKFGKLLCQQIQIPLNSCQN